MLALPAQSMAAIGMQLCAVVNQAGAVSQDDRQVAAHHSGAVAMAHHGAVASDPGAADTTQPSDNRMCSLCAFCVGAVALNDVVVGNPPLPTVEQSLVRPQRLPGLVADTPERPPRLLLA
ncbi:MAG: hypothetical protein Q8P85_17060 [Pseudomonas sp.]|nr:hypothetical protein [Pseudomonas sp.]